MKTKPNDNLVKKFSYTLLSQLIPKLNRKLLSGHSNFISKYKFFMYLTFVLYTYWMIFMHSILVSYSNFWKKKVPYAYMILIKLIASRRSSIKEQNPFFKSKRKSSKSSYDTCAKRCKMKTRKR